MQVEWCTFLLLDLGRRMSLAQYAILTKILTFIMITNTETCVLLNDVVNCIEYIA
jgi:hypothetical protein